MGLLEIALIIFGIIAVIVIIYVLATSGKKKPIDTADIPVVTKLDDTGLVKTTTGAVRPEGAVTPKPHGISFLSRVLYFLKLRHWIWSIAILALLFYGAGLLVHRVFGLQWGFYDPSSIQPIFGAILVIVIAMGGVVFIIYFGFREVYKYWFGKHNKDEKIIVNYSIDDFRKLESWQRLLLLVLLICFFSYLIVRVYLTLVK